MTQSVAQKTDIPEKTWRRQPDSPFGWIVFTLGSFILHLVAFWLISLDENSSQRGRDQSAIAIEFIEISPQKSYKVQSKPKPKVVSSKPSNTRAPQAAKPIAPPTEELSTTKPPVSTNNNNAIAFDNQKIEQQLQQELAQQQQQELTELQRQLEAQQRQREAEFQRQLEAQQRQLAQQQRLRVEEQRQLEAQLRQREVEQQRQLAEQLRQREAQQRQLEQAQRQREEEQRQLEQAQRQREEEQRRQLEQAQRQREEEQRQRQLAQRLRQGERSQQNQNPPGGENITDAIENRVGQTPQQRKIPAQAPLKETQLNQSGGILTASWDIDSGTLITRDIPANLPKPKEDISKNFVIPASEENNLTSANFQVYLRINDRGTIEFARIVDENLSAEKRLQYQSYVNKNLLNQTLFIPATDPDPRTGELKSRVGEIYIRINIQRSY